MFNKKILFIIILSLVSVAYNFAQEDDSTNNNNNGWKHHHRFRFMMFHDEFKGKPTISLNYGLSKLSTKNFDENFAKPNLLELKLGYTHENNNDVEENILDYNYKYFYISNISTNLSGGSSNSSDLKTDLWRFGFGRASGYGYELGSAAIIPYHTYSFEWSRLRMKDNPLTANDQGTTNLYNDSFRFGTSSEAGIRFKVIPNLILEAGYQRSIIFPRHIFWKWVGSSLIEAAGQWGIDGFVNEILDSSPYAVPVVNFVLKNALSYGIYELRQEKMNWPFDTVAPLSYDQFKFGLTFVF
ncbi:MAG: hypothetical protein M1480_13585 [Bacteroidetes bacterium]|nr:hypothetical protein [Bacteroidota bacterium]